MSVDRSDAADARRFRWLLAGNGYFMEEQMICGHPPCDEEEQDNARSQLDDAMARSSASDFYPETTRD